MQLACLHFLQAPAVPEAPRALHLTNGSVPHHPDGMSSARSEECRVVRCLLPSIGVVCALAAGTACAAFMCPSTDFAAAAIALSRCATLNRMV